MNLCFDDFHLDDFLGSAFHQFLQTFWGCKNGGKSVSFVEVMSQSKKDDFRILPLGRWVGKFTSKTSRFHVKDLDW